MKASHKLLGKLCSMVLGISGSASLLSLLQHALTDSLHHRHCICLSKLTFNHLWDLLNLASNVMVQPTHIMELLPAHPAHVYDLCDESKLGFGGVVFSLPSAQIPSIIWCHTPSIPMTLQCALISNDNPAGTLTNLDLELGGTILHEG